MLMVKVGRDITAFSASSALPVFTAGLGGVALSQISFRNPFSNIRDSGGAGTPLSHQSEAEPQQNKKSWV